MPTNPNTATLTYGFTYTDYLGKQQSVQPSPAICNYSEVIASALPVPDGAITGSEYDIAFPSTTKAGMLIVCNSTGQELGSAWGGNFTPHLPNLGCMMWSMPAAPNAGAITSWRFMLTQTQVGLGHIFYWLFGQF